MRAGLLNAPPLGKAKDRKPCPSVRDFGVVDMDQSDNVVTTYLVTANGQTAQMTTANIGALGAAKTQVNGSDNRLLAVAMDGALSCTPSVQLLILVIMPGRPPIRQPLWVQLQRLE